MFNDLLKGNKKFVNDKEFQEQRNQFLTHQNPSTVILTCSDSRVSIEYIFDVDLGKIFEVEIAGNVTSDVVLESIQYALDTFDVKDIIIMGHEGCGAVTSVYKAKMEGTGDEFPYPVLFNHIAPSIVTPTNNELENIKASIKCNCVHTRDIIKKLTFPRGTVRLHTAYYHLETGKVDFFSCAQCN